jgi:ATP-dependent DNA helicase RecQ
MDLFAEARKALKETFGFDDFRPAQKRVLGQILAHKDTLALMPTGGGKSLCYQIPALIFPGTAVVISPLVALMKDQVDSLRENGVAAAALNSQLSSDESREVRSQFARGELKLLYISPERLVFEIENLLPRSPVSLFAIDEAHCISQWGHDFRPEYTQLHALRTKFPQVPVIALTATADSMTREDILRQLDIPAGNTVIDSFDRPNLSLAVKCDYRKKDKLEEIVRFIERRKNQSGLIYCLSRKSTEDVADELRRNGIDAEAYHAGLDADERSRIQEDFLRDRTQVICATIAFGMGIDKSNIRFVIHYNTPKSMEGYYQEIGRAGRDGLPADTLLFYSDSDIVQLAKFAEESAQKDLQLEKLARMQHYATSPVCRRRILLSYFGETLEKDCGNCDICRHPPKRFDGTILAQKALSAIARVRECENATMITDILRGSQRAEIFDKGYDKLKTFGVGEKTPAFKWHGYLQQLIHLGCITMAYTEGKPLRITPYGREVLFGQKSIELALIEDKLPKATLAKSSAEGAAAASAEKRKIKDGLEGSDLRIFEALRAYRRELADAADIPPYIVFSDKVLVEIATRRPADIDEFAEVPGVGEFKLRKYGRGFLKTLRETQG